MSNDRRDRFAMAALQGLLACDATDTVPPAKLATVALGYADALIAALDKPAPSPTNMPCTDCKHFQGRTSDEPCKSCLGTPDCVRPNFERKP